MDRRTTSIGEIVDWVEGGHAPNLTWFGDGELPFGYISRISSERGIGFIVEDGEAEELEFHWTAITAGHLNQLVVGQRVQFETQVDHRDDSRRRAVKIRLLGRQD